MSSDFLAYLQQIKKPVFEHIQKQLPNKSPFDHYRIVGDYPQRQGKYFRPGLLLLSAKLFGGKQKKALPVAAALQIAEDWLLIHDDVEDHAAERRSTKHTIRPTLNKLYGDEIAINAGDALHVLMWKALERSTRDLNAGLRQRIHEKFTDMLLTTIEGQFLELVWRKKSLPSLTARQYFDIVSKKTGYYSVLGPIQLGALLAGLTSPRQLQRIEKWCRPLALAFQIWDDVLDMNSASEIGKSAGNDLQESKPTLLLVHVFKKVTAKESGHLQKILSKSIGNKTPDEIHYCMDLMKKYNSINYAQNAAEQYSNRAAQEFMKATAHMRQTPAQSLFLEAINFVSSRSK